MKRLKLTFVVPPDNPSGGMRVAALYARKLHERGHQVIVVIPQPGRPTAKQRISALVKSRIILRTEAPNAISFFREVPFEVRRLKHQGKVTDADVPDADIVIGTWWQTVEWVWSLHRRKGVKLHFMQDYEVWGHPDFIDIPRIDAVYALPIPKIVIADWERRLLEQKWQIQPIAVVPNGVDPAVFFSVPRGKQPVPTFGFTYSTIFDKGCNVTIAAIEKARFQVPNLRAISFGTTRPKEVFPKFIEFYASVPDSELRYLYSSCDAWLFGTRREGFGLPILEAMSCRTPVIGTPAGAGHDLISRGGGVLVPIDDPSAMAAAIVDFAGMPESSWRAISNIAVETSAKYSWDDATDRFEATLHRLIANH